ncbi:MAG: hypothetical protein F4120_11205 [Rhodothermaceae bacterium]|nr:hypothetical protein [Rhodothermaceae bacterium]MYI18168.1 hypothetical protein [Rhodothermaceae bacterium]
MIEHNSKSPAPPQSKLFSAKKWETALMAWLVLVFPVISVLGAQPPMPKFHFILPATEHTSNYVDEDTLSTMTTGANLRFSSLVSSEGQFLTFTLESDADILNENEGPTTVTVTARLNTGSPYSTPQTLAITVTGSGRADAVDFESIPSFDIVVAANEMSGSASFTLTPKNDQVDEVNETITISSTSSLVSSAAAPITLQDDDAPPTGVNLRSNTNALFEEDGEQEIIIFAEILSPTTYATTRVIPVTVTGTQAQDVVKFAPVASFNITLPAETASATTTFTITPENNLVDEANETITVASTAPFVTGSAMINLIDDDPTPSITLTASPSSISESNGSTRVTIRANWDGQIIFPTDQTIPLTVAGSGTALAVDFLPVPDFDLTIPQGASSGAATFIMTPINDSEDEVNETITISSSSVLVDESATVVLLDNDDAPGNIRLAADPSEIGEGDGATSVTLTATIGNGTTFAETRVFSIDVTGSGGDNVVGFSSISSLFINFVPGTSTSTATLELVPLDDDEDTEDEIVTLSSKDPAITESATIRLLDDDITPVILLSADPSSVSESDGETTINVTATVQNLPSLEENQTLPIMVRGSGRVEAVDFIPVADFDLVISAGTSTASTTFTLMPLNDPEDEIDESVLIESSSSLVTNSATVMILDDDDPGQVQLSVTPSTVYEGNGTQTVTVTGVIASGQVFPEDRIIPLSIRGSGQPTAVDFEPIADIDLIFKADRLTTTTTFDVTPIDDLEFESDESLTVSSADAIIEAPVAVQLINDDERPEGVTLTTSPESIREDAGPTAVTVTASIEGNTRYTTSHEIPLNITNSGESNSVQYLPITGVALMIPPGEAKGSVDFEITPVNNDIHQPNGMITIGSESDLVLGTTMIRLENDDAEPTGITVSLNPTIITEDAGETEVTLTVHVAGNTRYGVDKNLTLEGMGSGMPGVVGFSLTLPPMLSLPAGNESTSTMFLVAPVDNLLDESNETLTITAKGDNLGATAELSLTDDDASPGGFELAITPEIITEGDGPTTVNVTATLTRDTRYATTQTLDLSVAGPTIGTVSFEGVPDFQIEVPVGAESGSGSFTLKPVQNTIPETDATVTITAMHMGTAIRATLLLRDDDEATTRAADANAILLPEATRAIIASSVGAVHERIRVFQNGPSVQISGFSNGLSRVAMRLQNDQPRRYPVKSRWASQLNRISLAASIKERITVWAHADYRALSSNRNDSPLRYDGSITGFHGGVDLSFGRFLVGLSASQFDGDLDYEHSGGSTNRPALTAPFEGLYQINAHMLTPYINWSWNARSGVWAMVSFSSGEVEISDSELNPEEANTSLGALAVGVDLGLITAPSGFSLAIKGAAWGGQMNLDQNASRISGLDVSVYRFQMSLEGAYRIRLADQGLIQPFAEAGLRGDSGDGQTGVGLEMGGGARLSLPSAGIQFTGRGQVLVLHGRDIDEWAFSGMLRYAPGGNTGPNLELRSSTGKRFGNFQEIWQDTRWLARYKHRNAGTRLQSRLGYGLNVNHGSIMPYTGVELGHGVATQMGAEYQIGSQLNIRMEAAFHMQSIMRQSSPTIRALILLR